MAFNTGAALLDALVLSVASNEDTYGYKITQDVRHVMAVSESCGGCKRTAAWRPTTRPMPDGTAGITTSPSRDAGSWRGTGRSGWSMKKRCTPCYLMRWNHDKTRVFAAAGTASGRSAV